MEYTAFISRLSVEEITIKASSRRRASDELRKRVAGKRDDAIVHFGLAKHGKLRDISHTFHQENILRLKTAKTPRAEKDAVLRHVFDEIRKSWIVLEALSWCMTTEDLAIERGESEEEILASRDYSGEYEAFMTYIVSARRALNLADVLYEPEECEE